MTNHGTVKKSLRAARARNALRHAITIRVQSDSPTTAITVNGNKLGILTKTAAADDATPTHKRVEKSEKM